MLPSSIPLQKAGEGTDLLPSIPRKKSPARHSIVGYICGGRRNRGAPAGRSYSGAHCEQVRTLFLN